MKLRKDSTSSKSRLLTQDEREKIAFLRLFLVFLLVMNHFGGLYGSEYPANFGYLGQDYPFAAITVAFLNFVSFTAVPTLSVVSGYLFFIKADRSTPPDFMRKWSGRLRSLVLPFLIWSSTFVLLAYIAFRVSGAFPEIFAPEDGNRLMSIGNAWLAIDNYPFAIQLWFVRDLIVTVAISPLIWVLMGRVPVLTLATLVVLWLADQNLWIFIKLDVVGFFSLGAGFAMHGWRRNLPKRFVLPLFAVFLVLVFMRTMAPVYLGRIEGWDIHIATCLMRIVGTVTIWNLATLLITASWIRALTANFSYLAFFMHCAHYPPILAIKTIFGKVLDPQDSLMQLGVYFSTVFITVAGITITAHLMQMVAPGLFSILSGGRTAPKEGGFMRAAVREGSVG